MRVVIHLTCIEIDVGAIWNGSILNHRTIIWLVPRVVPSILWMLPKVWQTRSVVTW